MSGYMDRFIADARRRETLVVQPRMGFGNIATMRAGLRAVHDLDIPVVGTITVDSYTRVGDHVSSIERLRAGEELNGYPIVSHPMEKTREMLAGLYGPGFPIQVRHGTALPLRVIESLVLAGLDATEGGPVSYCLPYSRLPLEHAVSAWAESCRYLAGEVEHGHIESFGGCLLGQLCPPSLLIAMTVLEGLFFAQHGVRSMSLSYAQGTHDDQDRAAVRVLRTLAQEYLPSATWHVVLYTYMGLFPSTPDGATELIRSSARLARDTHCERLIVKTVSEAWQIPSVAENLDALRVASAAAGGPPAAAGPQEKEYFDEIMEEARCMIEGVLDLDADIGTALTRAFALGVLDIPFCLHADNQNRTTCVLDDQGALKWGDIGNLPFRGSVRQNAMGSLESSELYRMLNHVAHRYDHGQQNREKGDDGKF
ncbi:methylaspartate mutase [Streptomyces sp. R302]|uniref:methylaspartate mutase n=1 Tax=unclassified Streptomyces TaxID=2593676 RepID=UPI00145D8B65|nr:MULTISPECIES: methylaspartate mutase [unclassified Streptomyces]NML52136.1 methylaspartate mutase [Streptomyces sp. R301]NML82398.1 methylaspartate mutase [Streptomyces sp. R302]